MKPAPKPTAKPKPKPSPMDAIDRANREQAREAEEMKRMKKKPVPKYAKGGSIDGIAKKGKTKGKTEGKMVRMARGGMTGGCK